MLSPGENIVTVVPSQVSVPEYRQHGDQTSRIRCPCTATKPRPCGMTERSGVTHWVGVLQGTEETGAGFLGRMVWEGEE